MARKHTRRKIIILVILLSLILYILLGFYNPLVTTNYDYTSDKVPEAFDGYRIVQLTDFHCKAFGDKEDQLIEEVKNANPDLILLTGDFVDEKHTIENMEYLIEGIADIAPVYYVTGNHEYYTKAPYDALITLLDKYNVTYLDDETAEIQKDGQSIYVTGLDYRKAVYNMVSTIGYADESKFNILLYHGSNDFDFISNFNYDLVFSGHTHGGIMRLPFVGGVFGNDQDLFPKYDKGMFQKHNSTLVSSSGLGDAAIPRFWNPREIVCLTLHSAD